MADLYDRLHAALRALVREYCADLVYAKTYRYTVTSFDEGAQTADLSPVNPIVPLLKSVPIRLPGIRSKLSTGESVMIGFEEANPALPFVVSLSYASTYSDALPISRQGDMTATSMNLVPAISPAGSPIPGVFCIAVPPPYLPPMTASGGIFTAYGCVSSGSVFNKSK